MTAPPPPPGDRPAQQPYVVTPALRQRLDLLHHLLEFGRQILVVHGAPGCGRTRLLQAVMAEARQNWIMVSAVGRDVTRPLELLRLLIESLQLEPATAITDVQELIARVASSLTDMQSDGQSCVLLIDDAEALDESCCRLLFQLAQAADERSALRVVLSASSVSDFIERLQACAPHPALVHLVDVPPLSAPQVAELLQGAAGPHETAFDHAAAERLARTFDGNPGRILASVREEPRPTPEQPAPERTRAAIGVRTYAVVAMSFILVASVVGILVLAQRQSRPQPSTVEITLPARAPSAARDRADADAFGDPAAAPTPRARAGNGGESTASASPAQAAPVVAETAGSEVAQPPAATLAPAADDSNPRGDDVAPRDAPVVAAADTPARADAPATTEAPVVADTPARATRDDSTPATLADSAPAEDVAPPAPTAPPTPAASAIDIGMASGKPYTAAWLLQQSPQTYVIQLFGVRDAAAATRFIREHGLTGRAAVLHMSLERTPWYVVVLGHYADRAAASAAIRKLPAALARSQPWPRPVGSLRNE